MGFEIDLILIKSAIKSTLITFIFSDFVTEITGNFIVLAFEENDRFSDKFRLLTEFRLFDF